MVKRQAGGRGRAVLARPTAPAVPPDAHEWISFDDEEEDRTWVFDVTFLVSRWSCIFGRGCQGVLTAPAPELAEGCCSYGAHFTDDNDVARVESAAATLTAEEWQHRRKGRKGGFIRVDDEGTRVTRLVEGACIFLNRPGFPGGAGCALHRSALRQGLLPLELKPDVCWQLPLRRDDQTDDAGHVITTVRQWDRRHWGEGGAEFAWWCTEAPEAFAGADAVYQSMAPELEALVGSSTFGRLTAYLDGRTARPAVALPHPTVRGS